jgi:hypothetical protein
MLVLIFAVLGQDYTPLTRAERRAFVDAVNAVKVAAEDGNYKCHI